MSYSQKLEVGRCVVTYHSLFRILEKCEPRLHLLPLTQAIINQQPTVHSCINAFVLKTGVNANLPTDSPALLPRERLAHTDHIPTTLDSIYFCFFWRNMYSVEPLKPIFGTIAATSALRGVHSFWAMYCLSERVNMRFFSNWNKVSMDMGRRAARNLMVAESEAPERRWGTRWRMV